MYSETLTFTEVTCPFKIYFLLKDQFIKVYIDLNNPDMNDLNKNTLLILIKPFGRFIMARF